MEDLNLYIENSSKYALPIIEDREDLSEILQIQNQNGWNILHWNINGIINKIDDINIFLGKLKQKKIEIDIIMFCETHLNEDDIGEEPELLNYNSEHFIRKEPGGGVSIYISQQ
mgnify:CR=1 FL=1